MANEEKRIANEAKAIAVLKEDMLRYGINGSTKEKVARGSGLSLASISRYFPSKDSMVISIVNIIMEENAAQLEEIKASNKTGGELLKEMFAKIFAFTDRFADRFMLRSGFYTYIYRMENATKEEYRRMIDAISYRDNLREIVSRGMADGTIVIEEGLDADEMALAIAGECYGAVTTVVLGYDLEDAVSREKAAAKLTHIRERMCARYTK